jgi:Zn-dependent protease/CBS domain-containing protein
MKLSFKIGSAWGIPIELHLTFILLILAVLGYAVYFNDIYSFTLIVFLFVFVLFHELAHSVVARRYGIKVRKIVLYPIGGVSEIEEIPENPSIEWRMAISGPLTSVILGAALIAIYYLVPIPLFHPSSLVLSSGNLFSDLGYLNLLLGAFNLIPAFPMDGGRVFRALLAERMKFSDATKYAAYIGRIFGIIMVVVGLLFNFVLILIGVFIYIGASEEAEQTIVSTTLASVRVKDVMQSEIGAVRPDQTISEALEIMFKSRYHDALVEKEGIFQGIVKWNEIIKIAKDQRSSLRVEQMPIKNISTYPDEAVFEAYKNMIKEKIDLLPVVDKQNPTKVVGVLTSETVAGAYEKARNK